MQKHPTDDTGQALQPPTFIDPPSEGSSHTLNHAPGIPDGPAPVPSDTRATGISAHWSQKYLLTLDGGGIRGYSTLLVIKELMRVISEVEVERDQQADSSYHPLPFVPNKGSQVPENERSQYSVRYLPVHYFDYIAGTSTGGLIAIMLSRLRMNVEDCLLEYKTLGERIFGSPRMVSVRGPIPWLREKFSDKKLETVVKEFIERRAIVEPGEMAEHMFRSDEKRCRTMVFSVNKDAKDSRFVYIFRTYRHVPATDENQIELNPGPAHNIPTWQVARATSAAPTYFKEMKIRTRTGTTTHLDGGFGSANNPVLHAVREVNQMSGNVENPIALTISIGTGMSRHPSPFDGNGFLGKWGAFFRFTTHIASDSEQTHLNMQGWHNTPSRRGRYHRFNVDSGLEDIKLGEWETAGTECITIEKIESATTAYLQKPEVQSRLRYFAEILVDNRRARSCDQSKWNIVATGLQYHCTEDACDARNICHTSQEELRDHLKAAHRYSDNTEQESRQLDIIVQRGKILPSE